MIDKEELIENCNNLEESVEKQILELPSQKTKKVRFTPKEGRIYYTYAFDGFYGVICPYYKFSHNEFDRVFIEIGNCFKTRGEALFAGNCEYYTKRFETYVNRHSKKLDWSESNSYKYFVDMEANGNSITYDSCCHYKQQGTVYASSKQILKDAITDIGEENFLKYVMRVVK